MKGKNRLAIYISSYDGCEDLWDTFFSLFDIFWPDCKYPMYLVNNLKEYSHQKIKVIHTGPEICWFDRTIKSLEMLEEEYVLFLLEDYFLSKNVKNDCVDEIVSFMEKEDVFFYRLSKSSIKSKEPVRHTIDASKKYPINLQPGIWKREKLIEILKEIDGKSPWDFEVYFHEEYMGKSGIIKGVFYDTRDILGYKNGVLRGKWIPDTLKYYTKIGIQIDTGNREVLLLKTAVKYNVAAWVSNNLSSSFKSIIKRMLKKVNFDYLR